MVMKNRKRKSKPKKQTIEIMSQEMVQRAITEVCDEMKAFLLGKNEAYGNSALEPIRIMSRCSPLEGIRVRIDDKLNRMLKGTEYMGDNDIKDVTGYYILLMVGKQLGLS